VALAKVGGASNHWMGFAAVTAVFAARAVWHRPAQGVRPPGWTRWLATGGLGAGILLVAPVAASTWLGSLGASRGWAAVASDEFPMLIERVRHTQGEVLADPLDVLVLANRQPLFEPLLFRLFYDSGRWDVQPVVLEICDGRVGLVVLKLPIENVDWPAPVRTAVEQTMQVEGSSAGRLIYASSANRQTIACGTP
jgi:hypothetical protein